MNDDKNRNDIAAGCVQVSGLIHALMVYRFRFNNEKELQDQIAEVLRQSGHEFFREYRLARAEVQSQDIPDFWLPELAVVIEVKIKGAMAAHVRQCARYAGYQQVRGVILILPRGLKVLETLAGKPFYVVPIWKGCLGIS